MNIWTNSGIFLKISTYVVPIKFRILLSKVLSIPINEPKKKAITEAAKDK